MDKSLMARFSWTTVYMSAQCPRDVRPSALLCTYNT